MSRRQRGQAEIVPNTFGSRQKQVIWTIGCHPKLAPIKVAVFPLVKKDGMPETARTIYDDLKQHFNCYYDEKSAVGRRYRRQDEAGTPYCVTVDVQTAEDQTVTVRDRDSMEQTRIGLNQLKSHLREKLDM